MDAQPRQALTHRIHASREHAVERSARRTRCAQIAGGDQVGNRFGLCQVEFAVEKGPLAELTRTRLACTQRDAAGHQLP